MVEQKEMRKGRVNTEARTEQVHECTNKASRPKFLRTPCGGQPAREGDEGTYLHLRSYVCTEYAENNVETITKIEVK